MEVTIYSTTTCTYCKTLAQWLDAKGIAFTKKETDIDDQMMAEFMSVNDGNFSVPFSVIKQDNTITKIIGFDQKKFMEVLGI